MFDISNFISPKELMKMKEEVVEETLSLAYPIVALQCREGIVMLGQNPSASLHKTSELYDRIAFAGTGVFNDYERLRRAGVHMADVRGFQYSRADVKAKFIASEYSTVLGDIFTRQQVPMEVEILVTEIGATQEDDRMYYIPFSGGLIEEKKFAVIGDFVKEEKEIRKGQIRKYLREKNPSPEMSLADAARLGREAIATVRLKAEMPAAVVELVALDRTVAAERTFRRFAKNEIAEILNGG
jgi:proteasome alpha subunit